MACPVLSRQASEDLVEVDVELQRQEWIQGLETGPLELLELQGLWSWLLLLLDRSELWRCRMCWNWLQVELGRRREELSLELEWRLLELELE